MKRFKPDWAATEGRKERGRTKKRRKAERAKAMTGPELRDTRKALFLSQPGMARALGIPNGTRDAVRYWERGQKPIPHSIRTKVRALTLENTAKHRRPSIQSDWAKTAGLAEAKRRTGHIKGDSQ